MSGFFSALCCVPCSVCHRTFLLPLSSPAKFTFSSDVVSAVRLFWCFSSLLCSFVSFPLSRFHPVFAISFTYHSFPALELSSTRFSSPLYSLALFPILCSPLRLTARSQHHLPNPQPYSTASRSYTPTSTSLSCPLPRCALPPSCAGPCISYMLCVVFPLLFSACAHVSSLMLFLCTGLISLPHAQFSARTSFPPTPTRIFYFSVCCADVRATFLFYRSREDHR